MDVVRRLLRFSSRIDLDFAPKTKYADGKQGWATRMTFASSGLHNVNSKAQFTTADVSAENGNDPEDNPAWKAS